MAEGRFYASARAATYISGGRNRSKTRGKEMREICFGKGFVCACILAAATVSMRAQDVAPPAPPSPPSTPEVHVWKATTGGSFLGVGVKEIDSDRAKELKLRE